MRIRDHSVLAKAITTSSESGQVMTTAKRGGETCRSLRFESCRLCLDIRTEVSYVVDLYLGSLNTSGSFSSVLHLSLLSWSNSVLSIPQCFNNNNDDSLRTPFSPAWGISPTQRHTCMDP